MALFGEKREYDKNGDGRLSRGEWTRWYLERYGHDDEMARRRRRAAERAALEAEPEPLEADGPVEALEEAVYPLLAGLRALLGEGAALEDSFWQLTAYGITSALLAAGGGGGEGLAAVAAFYRRYPVCRPEELLLPVRRGQAAFAHRFRLEGDRLGDFWAGLLPALPPPAPGRPLPRAVRALTEGLGRLREVLAGQDALEEQLRLETLLEARWAAGQG